MLRISLIIGLLLTFAFLVKGIADTWRGESIPAPSAAQPARSRTAPEATRVRFYPPVPSRLPDLNQGYVFNEARSLADDDQAPDDNTAQEASVSISDVIYVGSVISGEQRLGIISYPVKEPPAQRPRSFSRPGRRGGSVEYEHDRLAPGETFSGFTVADVLPDRIIFEKGGRKIEKLLSEADKERTPPPPQVQEAQKTRRRPTGSTNTPRRVFPRSAGQTTAREQGGGSRAAERGTEARQPQRTPRMIRGIPQPAPEGIPTE